MIGAAAASARRRSATTRSDGERSPAAGEEIQDGAHHGHKI